MLVLLLLGWSPFHSPGVLVPSHRHKGLDPPKGKGSTWSDPLEED
jgi:hypothetical protein